MYGRFSEIFQRSYTKDNILLKNSWCSWRHEPKNTTFKTAMLTVLYCTLYSRCVIRNIVPQCTKRYFKWGNICYSAQRIMSNIVIFLQCTSSVSSGELFGKHNFTHLFIQYMYSICQETTNSDIIVHWVSVYCTVYLVYLD